MAKKQVMAVDVDQPTLAEPAGLLPIAVEGPLEMPLEQFNALRDGGTLDAYLAGLGRTFQGASINPNTGIVTL